MNDSELNFIFKSFKTLNMINELFETINPIRSNHEEMLILIQNDIVESLEDWVKTFLRGKNKKCSN